MADTVLWSNYGDDTIRRAPLAGGGPVDTLYSSGQGVSLAYGLAVDVVGQRLYWANYSDDTIRRAPLSGGGAVETLYGPAQGVIDPTSLAIDPAGGLIYWSDGANDGKIRRAPVGGGGPIQTLYDAAHNVFYPTSVAIDPAGGHVYWADGLFDAKIRRAPIGGGGPVQLLYGAAQGVVGTSGITVDAAAGRLRWINYSSRTIVSAPMAGGGPIDTLYDAAAGIWYPGRLVVDTAVESQATISPPAQAAGEEAFFATKWLGAALDWIEELVRVRDRVEQAVPSARLYWCNGPDSSTSPSAVANTIRQAPLAGGGTAGTLYGPSQDVRSPIGLAVLRAPLGTGLPTVGWSLIFEDQPFGGLGMGGGAGGGGFGGGGYGGGGYGGGGYGGGGYGASLSGPAGQRLTCSRGTWAPDLLGSFVYRAPRDFSFQWRQSGTDIPAANGSSYTPTASGSYSCRVTASNAAGSASQESAPITVTAP